MKIKLKEWLLGWRRRASVAAGAVDQAWQALRAGDLDTGQRIAQGLKDHPAHQVDAALLLGRVWLLRGQPVRAEEALRSGPGLDGDARLLRELGDVLALQSRRSEALDAFERSLALDPSSEVCRLALARLQQATGQPQAALDALAPLLDTDPPDFAAIEAAHDSLLSLERQSEALQLLTSVAQRDDCPEALGGRLASEHLRAGDMARALEVIDRQLLRYPDSVSLLHLGGVILQRTGRLSQAVDKLERASMLDPRNVAVLSDLGATRRALGQDEEALDNFQLAAHYNPQYANVQENLIFELHRQKRRADADSECCAWVARAPDNANAWFWKGKLAEEDDEIEVAAAAFEKALSLAPESVPILTNLGLVRVRQGRAGEAVELQRKAALLAPADAGIHLNLGFAMQCAGDIEAALKQYALSLELDPTDGTAQLHVSIAQLTDGDFEHGWTHYDKRWLRDTASARRPRLPEWQGEPLHGKRLLVWGEQGLGDQIMFASCLPEIARQADSCILECDPRLESLFRRSFDGCHVQGGATQSDLEQLLDQFPCDVHVAIGSLPTFTRRSRSAFPHHSGYLRPDAALRDHWSELLTELPGRLKVGLSWQGGLPKTRQRLRSQPLASWAPILKTPNIDFVNLQYTPCANELAEVEKTLGVRVWHWQDAIDDLDQMAALISQLDVVITVCNTAAHFSGALNTPAWVLTPYIPEWRYLAKGSQMPWYPSVTLFRQANPSGWEAAIDATRSRLEDSLRPPK